MISTSTEIVCPRAGADLNPIIIDLTSIIKSELRQEEVAIVTPDKAPELLAEFNRSWRELSKIVAELSNEYNKLMGVADRRKAVILLEVVPKRLIELDISSSADVRKAILDLDPEYQAAVERVQYVECVIEYLKGKMKSFENAYTSTKKLMADDVFNRSLRNLNLTAEVSQDPERPIAPSGWGTPKY